MNLILFGFKSSGKTTLGKQLAARLNRPFIDTDFLVEQLHTAETKKELSLRQIVITLGFNAFLELETRAVGSLAEVKESVIAVGGGTVLNPDTVNILEKIGRMIYLQVDKETLKKRQLAGELPTFLDPKHPEASFDKMYAERKPIYESIPAIKIDTRGKSESELLTLLEEVARGK